MQPGVEFLPYLQVRQCESISSRLEILRPFGRRVDRVFFFGRGGGGFRHERTSSQNNCSIEAIQI